MALREFNKNDGLKVAAYAGDGSVLLAFDIDEDKIKNLAGFAVEAVTPDKGPYPSNKYWLKNRLSFKGGLRAYPKSPPALNVIHAHAKCSIAM